MWIRTLIILDFIQIKETRMWYSLFEEGFVASSFLRIIGHEPCCAERDDARSGADSAMDILLEGRGELCGRDEVGVEGVGRLVAGLEFAVD